MRRDAEWGYRRTDLRWSPLFKLRISLTQKFSTSWPPSTLVWDKIERDHVSDELTLGNLTLSDLGITPEAIENRAEWELKHRRALAYYNESLGEFEKPSPPKQIIEY